MAQKSLSELKGANSTRPTPYMESITVKIVKKGHVAKFTDANGQQAELLNFSIADQSGPMLATLTDKSKQPKIVEGKTLMIRNFILKGGKIAMSSKTTIMGRPNLEIPHSIIENAIQLILPPSPEKKLAEVEYEPLRSILSVKGQIIKNEATRTVKVNGNDTPIRTITLEENNAKIDVTLWRELSEEEYSIGEFLQISHCLLNEWQGVRSLNSTRNTTIEKIQPLEVTIKGTVEALSLTESMWEVCVREEDKEGYKDLVVENDMLRSAIGRAEEVCLMTDEEIENSLVNRIPFEIDATMLGPRLLGLRLAFSAHEQVQVENMELNL